MYHVAWTPLPSNPEYSTWDYEIDAWLEFDCRDEAIAYYRELEDQGIWCLDTNTHLDED